MSTRCGIGIKRENGIEAIYCHNDGYPEWVGKVLAEHYTDENKINELMELGDLSSLDETIETCFAYHRDRGEEKHSKRIFSSLEDYTSRGYDKFEADYLYLYENGKWLVANCNVEYPRWKDLEKVVKKRKKG